MTILLCVDIDLLFEPEFDLEEAIKHEQPELAPVTTLFFREAYEGCLFGRDSFTEQFAGFVRQRTGTSIDASELLSKVTESVQASPLAEVLASTDTRADLLLTGNCDRDLFEGLSRTLSGRLADCPRRLSFQIGAKKPMTRYFDSAFEGVQGSRTPTVCLEASALVSRKLTEWNGTTCNFTNIEIHTNLGLSELERVTNAAVGG